MVSVKRIYAMILRYLYLHKRSIPRSLEIIFWPVMELLVWGFVTVYIQSIAQSPVLKIVVFMINGMIFWDILYRSQQGITISFMEEIWTQNLMNLLVSPLKTWEWLTATFIYGMLKSIIITGVLTVLALILYQFNLIGHHGLLLIPFMANLLIFGWALGVATSGLLIRWGYAVEALIWGVPFLIQPFSAIYYPVSALPEPLQVISHALPSTYVFEGMRAVLQDGLMPWYFLGMAFLLNLVYFGVGLLFFKWLYAGARNSGRLFRLGMD